MPRQAYVRIISIMSLDIDPIYQSPVFKKDQPDDSFKFQPLPKPTGKYPYHLSYKDVIPELNDHSMVFHMVGDTGSIRSPDFQKLVSVQMSRQYTEKESNGQKPEFLFHLGDIVYNFGELQRYSEQFFEPYKDYPGQIFAISGNHDSDVNPDNPVPYKSLDAFTKVFCSEKPVAVSFSKGSKRLSGVQPNVYWTFQTPLANIIGLYGNVTKFGIVTPEQREWFHQELTAASSERPEKALIVCIHHAPYSADINHGSSEQIIGLFEEAFLKTRAKPDIVFSGHVHNYQRFIKKYPDGTETPFIVAGAGGYDELHPIAAINDGRFTAESPLFEGVSLENHCGNKHGFLKVILQKENGKLSLTGEYYTIPHEEITSSDLPATLADRFVVEVK